MQSAPYDLSGAALSCGVFIAIAAAEMIWPARPPAGPFGRRWFGNISLYLLSGLLFMAPFITASLAAVSAAAAGFGLLPWLGLDGAVRFVAALLILDLASYAFHRMSHAVGPLWRLHAVHHSDPDVDVTTAVRHHPAEALAGAAVITGAVVLAGISPEQIAAYAAIEWVVQSAAHANLALPPRVDGWLRRVMVTPGFHGVHHSRAQAQTDSNYGQVLTVWDGLFGTVCRPAPAADAVAFGLDGWSDAPSQGLHRLLAQPFMMRDDGL